MQYTHFVRLSGVTESAFLWNAGECVAVPANRRLANGGVKKSVRTSVKNGELSEAARNAVKRCKFSPFSERVPILAGICAAAKRISFR